MQLTGILQQYWGYDSFRPLQPEIIRSVLQGKDTLALLPTGGGKSICYQVPSMAQDGICLVISPLIALMKDQFENLEARGIKALAVFSGMSAREIDVALDNAVYGDYKFLYLSPERLQTEMFLERAPKMKVNLIAVDEAHCISEWGYDFRPAYLKIAEIRKIFPSVPILALTASATYRVREDICEKLSFRKGYEVFSKSFDRSNLVYAVLEEQDKKGRLVKLFSKVPGTGIVYAATRKDTKEIAVHLQQHGFSADHYNAGLDSHVRARKQEEWKSGKTRIMVCTNAFGMGIDKPDVRMVVHYQVPDSLEAYYQEAGRGGRDEGRSFAIALVNNDDKEQLLQRIDTAHPSVPDIKKIYHALGNYFQLPEGAGAGQSFDFSFSEFCNRYALNSVTVYNAFKSLEDAGYITLNEAVFMPSRFMVIVDNETIYGFEIANKKYEPLIKTLLRTYGGCFQEYVKLDEMQVARRSGLAVREVVKQLHELTKLEMLDYVPQTSEPQVTFLTERLSRDGLFLDSKYLKGRKEVYASKVKALLDYASARDRCRGRILLEYFGEITENDCGHCDHCLQKQKHPEEVKVRIQKRITEHLQHGPMPVAEILNIFKQDNSQIIEVIRYMLDKDILKKDGENLTLKAS